MKVKIKAWNAVASWRWDVPEDDVCGICRVQFDGTCPNCRFPGDDCPLRIAPLPFLSFFLNSADFPPHMQLLGNAVILFIWWAGYSSGNWMYVYVLAG